MEKYFGLLLAVDLIDAVTLLLSLVILVVSKCTYLSLSVELGFEACDASFGYLKHD